MVDNPLRDLPSLVLLAARLCASDCVVLLVPVNLQRLELWPLVPDFVLLNYLRTNNEDLARELGNAGIPFGALDTEGGVLADLDSYGQYMAQDPAVRSRLAVYCSWGEKLAGHIVESGWLRRDQVVLTGSPRFDFYASPWRAAALAAAEAGARLPESLVLVNGNFSLANPGFQTPEQEAEMLVREFGYARDQVMRWQDMDRAALHALAAMTNRLADEFPDMDFVYRPHPFERLETYDELIAARPNLRVIRSGTVDGWVLRAKAVIQRSCSTAIEATMARVPALSPAWIEPPVRMEASEAVSMQCEDHDAMQRHVASAIQGTLETPAEVRANFDTVIRDWFFRIDGKAHDRIAAAVLDFTSREGRRSRLAACRTRAYDSARSGAPGRPTIGTRVVRALRLPVRWSLRRWRDGIVDLSWWDASAKTFDAPAVRTLLDAIVDAAPGMFPSRFTVASAEAGSEYRFGYRCGRSVAIYPSGRG